ncbi:MAG TPA: virulence-associated protein [Gemmataceae bacterium]|nr:virulence-associated protein [Gemmataceae bacterium]
MNPPDIALYSVVLAELPYGAYRSAAIRQAANLALITRPQQQFISLPFDNPAAGEQGRNRAQLACLGTLMGTNDLMIASIALANGLILLTHNTSEFSRDPGLKLEEWHQASGGAEPCRPVAHRALTW